MIASVDPGGTTGLAFHIRDVGYVTTTTTSRDDMLELLVKHTWDIIIIEKFATAGRLSTFGLYTIELVGACMAVAYMQKAKCVIHMPFRRKPFLAKAKALLQARSAPFMIHEVDALAHLYSYENQGD